MPEMRARNPALAPETGSQVQPEGLGLLHPQRLDPWRDPMNRPENSKYPLAPVHILDGIWDYAQNHREHGGFITAVLENNLSEAFGRAVRIARGERAGAIRRVSRARVTSVQRSKGCERIEQSSSGQHSSES